MIDNNLSWHSHINYQRIFVYRIKHFLDSHARKLFIQAYILPCISYCSTLFDSAGENATNALVRIYKRAIKAAVLKYSSVTTRDYVDLSILLLKSTYAKTTTTATNKQKSNIYAKDCTRKRPLCTAI